MNKQLFFVLAAIVLGVVAQASPVPEEVQDEASQLALFEADDVETGSLGADKAIFSDFCLQARDEVRAYLKSSVNTGTAKVFNLLVDTASQVSSAIAAANSAAATDGAAKVAEDATQIKGAIGGIFGTMSQTTKQQLLDVFNNVKEQLNTETLKETAEEACVAVSRTLKPAIEKKFTAYKKEVFATPEGKQLESQFSKLRIEQLGCVTTSRLTKVVTGCNMIRTIAPSLFEFMGLA